MVTVFSVYLILTFSVFGMRADRCFECPHIPIQGRQSEYDCSHCNLQAIPKFPSSATGINLSFNNITTIGGRNFSEIINLQDLNLGNNFLSVIERSSFSQLKSLHTLVLNGNKLNSTSLESLRDLHNLMYLDIRDNIYKTYPESITFLLKLNVLQIDIFRNFHFNDSFLSLRFLKEIIFQPRGMVTLLNNSFEGIRNSPIKNLKIILQDMVAGEIGIDFLRPFTSLNNLTLNIGGRFDIKDVLNVFYGIRNRNMNFIDISDNRWEIIRYHHLTNDDVSNLFTICVKEINLSRNDILYFPFQKSIDYNSRNFSTCVEKLIISYNPIIWKVSDLSLLYYPSLKYIDTSFPQQGLSQHAISMTKFPKKHNLNLHLTIFLPKNIEYIDVSGTDVRLGFAALSFLETSSVLIVEPNLNSLIAKDTSCNLCNYNVIFKKSLRVLEMSGWECSNMNPKFIQQHYDLTLLRISNSKIGKQIKKGGRLQSLLSGLAKLEAVDLSFNNIENLEKHFFIHQSDSLVNINLSNNNLIEIPEALIVLKRTNTIDLSFTDIAFFTKTDIRILETLRNSTFDFGGNKFECTCEHIDTLVWMNLSRNVLKTMMCKDGRSMNIILSDLHNFQLRCISAFWLSFAVSSILILLVIILVVALGYRNKSFIIYLFIKARRLVKRDKVDTRVNEYKYDAFVSYSHLDYNWVTGPFLRYLTNILGLEICLHQKDFIPGNPIAEEILRCVESSRKSIFIITRNFLASKWSLFEMDIARHHVLQTDSDTLIVILKDEIPVHEMPPLLRKIWWRIVCLKYPTDENNLELDIFNRKLSEVFQN